LYATSNKIVRIFYNHALSIRYLDMDNLVCRFKITPIMSSKNNEQQNLPAKKGNQQWKKINL